MDRRRGKRRIARKGIGEIGKAEFLPAVRRVGFRAAKAWGDSDLYDSIVDSGWKPWRTQVKCIAFRNRNGYLIFPRHRVCGGGRVIYTSGDIDLLVVYIIPCDVWYAFPMETVVGVRSLLLFPEDEHHPKAKWEHYREVWHLPLESLSGAAVSRSGPLQGPERLAHVLPPGVGADPTMPDK